MSEEKYDKKNREVAEDVERSSSKEVIFDKDSFGKKIDKQQLYITEQQKVEQAIEKSGEKLKQDIPTDTQSDDDKQLQNNDSDNIDRYAREIIKLDADDQVAHLVQIATTKSPYLAIEIAKHLRNNYVLAELHSDLTEEKMQQMLIEKGLL